MYTFTPNSFVVTASSTAVPLMLSDYHSWDDLNNDVAKTRFESVHTLFSERIAALHDPLSAVTDEDIEELHMMLDALCALKKQLGE